MIPREGTCQTARSKVANSRRISRGSVFGVFAAPPFLALIALAVGVSACSLLCCCSLPIPAFAIPLLYSSSAFFFLHPSSAMELSASMINEMMQQDGPTVEVVVLRAAGAMEQITLDTTPRLNLSAELLGGAGTFIGQYEKINVVLMCVRVPTDAMPMNVHKLQPPFSGLTTIKGDILVMRVDDNGVPANFTKEEWERFSAEDIPMAMSEEGDEEAAVNPQCTEAEEQEPLGDAEDCEDDDEDDGEYEDDEEDEEEDDDDDAAERDENVTMSDDKATASASAADEMVEDARTA